MIFRYSSAALAGTALLVFANPAFAAEKEDPQTAWEASRSHEDDGMIGTGVARARDRLDSATSTSSMASNEIVKMSATSLSDLFRNIPGIRSEASVGEGNNGSYTIRGLPLASTGAKYLQFQEDGLPVLEFGDILGLAPDVFLRPDFNIAQIESIRGGSASPFASIAPGGVINLISHTGEIEGGSVQASAGLNFENFRTDFDYGTRLSDTLRFHIGGFYREGSGPRGVGYTANHGGQVKFNITKDFSGGFIRLYAKLLDDHNAQYAGVPLAVSGTDADPVYKDVVGLSANRGSLLSRNIAAFPVMDGNNNLSRFNVQDGAHVTAKSIGLETRFTISDWTVSERMRFADQSGDMSFMFPLAVLPASVATFALGAPGGSLAYASGPQKGQQIANPAGLNGNGLLAFSGAISTNVRSADNFTNDLRISRVWNTGGGSLTGTVGLYMSRQDVKFDRALVDVLQDVRGNGSSSLIDVIKADGTLRTQGGAVDFSGPSAGTHSSYDVAYSVLAPYGSINFHKGKIAVGGSFRVDTGKAEGSVRTNAPANLVTIDVNQDGVISDAERTFAVAPFSNAMPVDYRYHYVSYSGSVNYRASKDFSAFARYSRGARAGADRILFSPAVSPVDGSLLLKQAAYDPVKQAEIGVKFRHNGLFANLTGYWAKVSETNTQLLPDANGMTTLVLISRSYRAFGGEFEGGWRKGPFSLTVGATVTDAKITGAENPALVGNRPRHQAPLIFQFMPQYDTDLFTIGANVIGTTASYAQDDNRLRMPGFTTVNGVLQVRPIERLELSLNASNLFNTRALTDVSAATIPASGVVIGQALQGRTIWAGARFYF
jgi:outer membrane receptor protein involved in Fe transport